MSELGKENLGEGIVQTRARIGEDIFCSRNVLCGEVKSDNGRLSWMVSRVKLHELSYFFFLSHTDKR